jgi:hypothetical protein
VGGIGGDEEDGFANFGELDGEGTGRGGFTDSSFATHKDPAETGLIEDGLEGGF